MPDENTPLFVQIADAVEDSIIDGSLAEGRQAPSTNELAAFYRINPATAAKGVNQLVGKQILFKQRGVGMFVSPGAREQLVNERRRGFVERFIDPLLAEANRLGLGPREDSALIDSRSSVEMNPS